MNESLPLRVLCGTLEMNSMIRLHPKRERCVLSAVSDSFRRFGIHCLLNIRHTNWASVRVISELRSERVREWGCCHMSILRRNVGAFVSTAVAVLFTACMSEIPATNPFDPAAPKQTQEKGSIEGSIFTVDPNSDADSPVALADARVELLAGPTKPENNPVTTGEDGTYSFTDLLPGTYQVVVTHPTHEKDSQVVVLDIGANPKRDVTLTPRVMPVADTSSGEVSINYTLTGEAKLGNQSSVDESAKDHSGIVVQVRTKDEEPTSIQMTTGPDGRFGFSLNPGEYKLYFSARNHKSSTSDVLKVVEGEVFNLGEPVVLDINPGAISGVVRVEGAGDDGHDGVTISLVGTDKAPVTGDNGTFQLDEVGAGVHRLVITKEGFDKAEVAGVVVNAGETTQLTEPIEVKRSRGTIKGQITLAGSMNSDGVAVQMVSSDGRDSFTTLTNSDGEYRFEKVPVGQYAFQACKQGYLPPSELNARAVTADTVDELPTVTMNKPLIAFVPQEGQPPGRYFTNEETIRLRFSELPVDQLTGVKITGDAQASAGQVDEQGWVNGQVTTNDMSAYLDLTLQPGDGAKLIQVQFRNDGCFVSDVYQLVITLDRTGPQLINARFAEGDFSNSREVRLNIISLDAHRLTIRGDIAEVENQVVDGDSITVSAKPELTVRLTDGDGPKSITLSAIDAAGNLAASPETISAGVVLDTEAPTNGTLTIEDGADYTGKARVLLALSADDANGVTEVLISNDATFVGAQWQPYQRTLNWVLNDSSNGDVAQFAANDGEKRVYARFRDAAGNEVAVDQAASDTIELDRLGSITVRVAIDGPDATPLTNITLLRGPEADAAKINVNLGSPNGDGQLVIENVPVGTHYLSAQLDNFYVERFVAVDVGPKQSNPEISRLLLKYETGTLAGHIQLAEAVNCPDDIQVLATNIETAQQTAVAAQFQPDCQFAGTLPVGRYSVKLQRADFEDVVIDGIEIQSFKTYDLGSRILPRARGTIEGGFNLQGRTEHEGINVTLVKREDAALGEAAPTYTTVTVDGGRFSREGLWAGRIRYQRCEEGFIKQVLSETVRVVGGRSVDATVNSLNANDEGIVVLQRQTGDFLINGGAEYTNARDAVVELEFVAIQEFQYRINGSEFSEWIAWAPTDDSGKIMEYGINLPAVDGDNDTGNRLVEIRTKNLQGIESGEPYYQTSIILDQTAPDNPSVIIDDGRAYTNSSLGLVSLRLAATDLNQIYRVRLSDNDDCQTPNRACETPDNPFCDSVLYEPTMQYSLVGADTDGNKSVYACFIDPAGNVSAAAMANIILDRAKPVVQNLTVRDVNDQDCSTNCKVNENSLRFTLTEGASVANTDSTASEMWVSIGDAEYSQGAWQVYQRPLGSNAGDFVFPLLDDDGEYTVYVRTRDQAGNSVDHTENPVLSFTIDLDTTPPVLPVTADTEYFIREQNVAVTFTNATDEIRAIQWSWDQTWTETEPVARADTLQIPLPIADGQNQPEQSSIPCMCVIGMSTVTQGRHAHSL